MWRPTGASRVPIQSLGLWHPAFSHKRHGSRSSPDLTDLRAPPILLRTRQQLSVSVRPIFKSCFYQSFARKSLEVSCHSIYFPVPLACRGRSVFAPLLPRWAYLLGHLKAVLLWLQGNALTFLFIKASLSSVFVNSSPFYQCYLLSANAHVSRPTETNTPKSCPDPPDRIRPPLPPPASVWHLAALASRTRSEYMWLSYQW